MQPSSPNLRSSTSLGPLVQVGLLVMLTAFAIAATFKAGWWSQPAFVSDANQLSFFLYVGGAFVVGFALLLARIRFIWIPIILFVAYVQFTGLGPGLSVLWFWICASLIGSGVARLAGVTAPGQFTLRNAVLGFAVIGTVIGIVAHFPCNYPWVYFVAISGAALFAVRGTSLALPAVSAQTLLRGRVEPFSVMLVQALIAAELALILATILLPEVGHDALSMHLNIPARMLADGRWGFDVTTYVWSVMPFGADWLYTPPYFLGGEAAVRLFNASCLIATAAHVHALLKDRFGSLVAATGPALLLSLPLCYLEIGSVFVDAPLALFFSLVLGELLGDASGPRRLLPLAVIIGFACAMKLNSVLMLPFLFIWLIYTNRSRPVPWGQIVCAVLIFTVFSGEPYVVAWVKTGNPVFPFFNAIFKSPYYDVTSSFTNPYYVRPFGPGLLYDAVFTNKGFGEFGAAGGLGFLLIALVPFAIVQSARTRLWWILWTSLASLGYALLVFKSQAYLRYIFPVIPWMIVCCSAGLAKISRYSAVVVSITLTCVVGAIVKYPVVYGPLAQFDIGTIFLKSDRFAFLSKTKPEVVAGRILALRENLAHDKILLLGIDPIFSEFPTGTISDSWHSVGQFPVDEKALPESVIQNLPPGIRTASPAELGYLSRILRSGAELIVSPVGRGFRDEGKIEKFTEPEFRLNDIRVGRVIPEIIYSQELAKNPDFTNGLAGWVNEPVNQTAEGIQVTVDHPIAQNIDVKDLRKVLITMAAQCPRGGLFRSQINWNDKNGTFVATDIATHECTSDRTEVKRILEVPRYAVTGTVFGSSHTPASVTLLKLSVRGRIKRSVLSSE